MKFCTEVRNPKRKNDFVGGQNPMTPSPLLPHAIFRFKCKIVVTVFCNFVHMPLPGHVVWAFNCRSQSTGCSSSSLEMRYAGEKLRQNRGRRHLYWWDAFIGSSANSMVTGCSDVLMWLAMQSCRPSICIVCPSQRHGWYEQLLRSPSDTDTARW